ncbi:hypothetical protein DL98DRAFT_564630, partial [Cadophora sp. DSE1049]
VVPPSAIARPPHQAKRRVPSNKLFEIRCARLPKTTTNHGGVYSRLCCPAHVTAWSTRLRSHKSHNRSKRREHKQAKLSWRFWIKASKHTSCEICQNYQEEEDHPTIIGANCSCNSAYRD